MKFILLTIVFYLLFFSVHSQLGKVGTAVDVSEEQGNQSANDFVMKGWLKFFTHTPTFSDSFVPKKFEYNPGYLTQSSSDKDKDSWGSFNIPDDTHFFFVLTRKTLYAMNSRRNDIAKTYKSIEMEWIEPTVTGDLIQGYKGGLEDVGNFREGFCFRLKLTTNVIWNICADSQDQKEKWMKTLFGLLENTKSNYQGTGDSFIISHEIKLPFNINTDQSSLRENKPPPGSKVDGRWVILQDWSQCSLICGGGKQYLQRMCVPPQNGGLPCDGEALLDKDCNTQACPNMIEIQKQGPANPTTIKMQRLYSNGFNFF